MFGLSDFINASSFYGGALIGAACVCALVLISKFLRNHWKSVLLLSVVVSALSLAAIAFL